MYQQEARERKFGHLKSSYHKNTNKGGGKRKESSERSQTGPLIDKLLLRLYSWSECTSVEEFHEQHTKKIYRLLGLQWPSEEEDLQAQDYEGESDEVESDEDERDEDDVNEGSDNIVEGNSTIASLARREFRQKWGSTIESAPSIAAEEEISEDASDFAEENTENDDKDVDEQAYNAVIEGAPSVAAEEEILENGGDLVEDNAENDDVHEQVYNTAPLVTRKSARLRARTKRTYNN